MVYASRLLRWMVPNMEGPDIFYLQERLQIWGYFSAVVNGIFDTTTGQALINFQKAHLLKADGMADYKTWIALNSGLSSAPVSESQSEAQTHITIDVDIRRLYFSSTRLQKDYPVAIGKPSTPSPLGNWNIVQKALNPGGPFGTRWMRLSVPWGGYGIHGTNNPASIGHARSHGCIRMYNQDVEEIYPLTPIGTPVSIVGKTGNGRVLKYGTRGQDVKKLQEFMQKLGYDCGPKDGYFGSQVRRAVSRFQEAQELPISGMLDSSTGLVLIKAIDLSRGDVEP